ncbi:MAG: hypothetical protein KJ565_01675 [Gammaproteobacteria bacterium]|uniref:hypothetical protein n=1 Tax=Hydrogenophaga sp. TaxID=1904254 RepID=UPI0025BDBE61|nr:hypothetical protein [Hydrogenophaga sp.]MBU4180376.1 hypothetical protein [Gammaproteobacteria bacterium]MBU4282686.1 hypothetical protein [Gammaproteobacteria bacterium]MBU4324906.1 hypothetical protein [Gammaproteobacteria bacterium]MBU4508925.1 hypothetical protein [Gammaproteobacteria bacterium]MCG2654552.1 hypothetical protein [Hydrogenophaga sp.]
MQTTRRKLLAHSAALPFLPLAGLGLTACSTVETTSVQSRLRGKSITVISTIGTTLRLTWRGTTLFNNEFGEAFVPDWGYKEQLENRTVELLRASGRFSSVQRVTITATRREEALKELKELKTPTDHVLLISGAPSADSIWATREGFFGLGIAQRSILQLGTESVAHASLRVDLLVPSTFGTVLGEATVSTAQRVPAPALLRGPRLNDDHAAAARESLRVQVDAAVQSLVSQLGLGKSVPASAPASSAPKPVPAPAAAPTPPSSNAFPVTSPNVEGRGIPAPSGAGASDILPARR